MKNKEVSAADSYRASLAGREEVIVDVHLPSGNIFKFAALPSVFKSAFSLGRLPEGATAGAVESWIKEGIIQPGEISEDKAALVNEGMRIRDMILDHSRVPKLVVGEAKNPGELSTDELSNDDAKYLFDWARAGGETSLMLNTFPKGPEPDPLAGANRKTRRAAGKRTS